MSNPQYHVIYDGNCNLCVTFTQLLEQFDRGNLFDYTPMQDDATLARWGIACQSGALGMILLDANDPNRQWQGSAAAEEIARLLPLGDLFVQMYRSIPGMKTMGDRIYDQVRDNRYAWFGERETTYYAERRST
jgi:predicted DCC family thiol-disulfide oxidoreductase YuxK